MYVFHGRSYPNDNNKTITNDDDDDDLVKCETATLNFFSFFLSFAKVRSS